MLEKRELKNKILPEKYFNRTHRKILVRDRKIVNKNYFRNKQIKSLINIKAVLLIVGLLFLALSFMAVLSAASYSRSAPAYTFGRQTVPFTGGQLFPAFDRNLCQAGQDFILQIDPLGCTPSVVRSDLLEEQEVVVFCPVYATQLNPLIKVEKINHITISSRNLPREVLTVGYYPARAALGRWNPDIATPIFDNIGYATIVLRQQRNESAMPDFVEGNLTATMRYNIHNAFGTGRAIYYLPQLTDEQWNRDYTAYGFWDGRGYLRLEGADNDGATIGVYSDRDFTGTGRRGEKTRIAILNLEKGGKPGEVFMLGFNYCLGGVNVKLVGLENPDTRARLRINSEVMEVARGVEFLENKCKLTSIIKQGINQRVEISCEEDEKRNKFTLRINPNISLSIDGIQKEYGVGDFLYEYEDTSILQGSQVSSVYLGFIGNSGTTNSPSDLYIRFVSIPKSRGGNVEKLSESEISRIASYDKGLAGSDIKGDPYTEVSDAIQRGLTWATQVVKSQFAGKKLGYLHYSAGERKISGTNMRIIGYSGVFDADLSQMPEAVRNNYEKAIMDYETIKESFSGERYPPNDLKTLGEQALSEAIILSNHLGQRKTAFNLCQEFLENYDSVVPEICTNELLLSNLDVSAQSVVINGKTHIISFEGIREPGFEEFGLEVLVSYPDGSSIPYQLSKDEIVYLNDTTDEYIQLTGLEEDSATLRTSLKGTVIKTPTQRLRTGAEETFGSSYSFSIQKINFQKVAKVSIDPQIDYARTNATFSFKIGIEKRGIKLSPEKTRERIQSLNKIVEKWTRINDNLGKVVKAGKTACLATAGVLTIKNFLSNLGGKGIARQQVMRAEGVGWYDRCQEEVKKTTYDSVEACLLDNNDKIEASVNAYDSEINQQNQEIKQLKEGISSTRFFGEEVVNTDALATRLIDDPKYRPEISSNLQDVFAGNQIKVANQDVNVADIIARINTNTTTISQARALQLNSRLLDSGDETVKAIARKQTEKILGEIYSNSRAESVRQTYLSKYGIPAIIGATKPLKEYPLTQINTFADLKSQFTGANIPDDTYVSIFVDQSDGREYLLVLNNDFIITQTYSINNGVLSISDNEKINPLGLNLKRYDATAYKNKYTNPEVRYYETEPYKGFPAVVPFDVEKGWYAALKSNLPILGGLKAFDASGRVSSFYVCNVGQNGREEFIGGDDICRGFFPESGQSPDFPGLDERESKRKMEQAVSAIIEAQKAYGRAGQYITINNQRIKVGRPAADIPDIQCEDFMSPSDCNLMFNVCDPFVCPSSRCDLGGAYPVKDVVQSGIAGSLALCLPNFPEVKVPICVSGVHAGLEGYLSVLESYQQCLQESLDTGQTIGICDELNSVYMCEFFWRQGIPIIKYAIPKIAGSVLGQGARGGGEYLGVTDALDNAEKSIDYFSQYYAANSFAAFKARSAEGVGSEICRNWISFTGSKGGNLLDALTAPDSPPQFLGRFEEIPYTTATVPPASQYKVFYHIYAGKDFPAYFQVYLRGTPGSFYRDTDIRRPVAAGFIPRGEFKSETKDFTAPSGYKEMCIVVNNREECGFKQVTTEFGINFLSEQYVASQASQTDIKSEAECVSGSPSAFSFLNPNIQAGAEEALNPAIYNRGIIRVCSTENPGINTDPSRWNEVGNCGTENLKCWLDTDSVRNVVRNAYTEEQILGEVQDNYLKALQAEGRYIADFDAFKKEIDELEGKDTEMILKINENIMKIFLNNQKAHLHLRRGNAYGNLAFVAYKAFIGEQEKGADTQTTQEQHLTCEDCGKGLFNLCDELECIDISRKSGKACSFEDGIINSCKEDLTTQTTPPTGTTGVTISCTDEESCQELLGLRIIELAGEKKAERNIVDSRVKKDTGAEKFECLALQVAMVESSIQHCKQIQVNENPLYCDGNKNEIISGDEFDSLGVMQINTRVHRNVDVADFEINVNYGLDLLINGYSIGTKIYTCYRPIELEDQPVRESDFAGNDKIYSGWQIALRNYNGWNTKCLQTNDDGSLKRDRNGNLIPVGNPNYVEGVIAQKSKFNSNFFPECA